MQKRESKSSSLVKKELDYNIEEPPYSCCKTKYDLDGRGHTACVTSYQSYSHACARAEFIAFYLAEEANRSIRERIRRLQESVR